MRVTVLGTGAALATGNRVQTGILIERWNPDRTLLVDCGSGVLHRLAAVGCDPTDIDAVLLTHTHLDHVSDLAGLAKARWMRGEPTIPIVGPEGTEADISPLFQIDDLTETADISEFVFPDASGGTENTFEITESPGHEDRSGTTTGEQTGEAKAATNNNRVLKSHRTSPSTKYVLTGLPAGFESVTAVPTVHSRSGAAYRFGDSFAFSGDTETSVDLLSSFDGVDVLVHDCARPPECEPDNHPTPESLATALEKASPAIEHLYLSHLYPAVASKAEEVRSIVSVATDATVHIASDTEVVLDDS